ncbi:MAG: hypothetical protein ACJ8GN_29305 [Longimicrobiaceae bacterium]
MLSIPFEILSCSWPRPVDEADRRWVSEPEWNAPPSPLRPQPQWRMVEGEAAWTIDWCALFRGGIISQGPSEMRRFHVVFRIRVAETGRLVFWDDDGSIVRLGGRVVHEDREAHPLRRAAVEVQAGDVLEVAQWQLGGDWLWGARTPSAPAADAEAVFAPHRELVAERVHGGGGPPLKLYTDGRHPLRAAVGAYSLVLNGYAPSAVHLYGAYQWSPEAAALFREAFPFAEIVDTERVLSTARALGGVELARMALRFWYVMKVCSAMLDGPDTFCLMDDDVLVLDPVDDALDAFRAHDLVFIPDMDYGPCHHRTWSPVFGRDTPTPGGTFNAGLFWCRGVHPRAWLAERMPRVPGENCIGACWDQGFIATAYADRPLHGLAANRHFYPVFEGLPAGILGYDYAANPCGFASLHFGGIPNKPDDAAMRYIGPQVLGRRAACAEAPELALAG